jgi:uncharacterized membrane protein
MSYIASKMSQKLHISGTLNRSEYSLARYGQIVIYLFAIGVISYLYISIQKIIINYLDSLALGQLPEF